MTNLACSLAEALSIVLLLMNWSYEADLGILALIAADMSGLAAVSDCQALMARSFAERRQGLSRNRLMSYE